MGKKDQDGQQAIAVLVFVVVLIFGGIFYLMSTRDSAPSGSGPDRPSTGYNLAWE